ncbi:flagellin [Phaeobacter gallaeciensis]|jgi:flagellin|uniref:flagellin N-terminal helical domain-containing protein n=1 Tax=Phaeobacter gallaeciensis TaxID=60890 RepID=UPI00237EF16C|nr:flagellin [Phaeobacter gallaeciensis]MDE4276820.1 flagellin [Phaeobacter gallaeciensis]MDE4302056.1 flagellin [Phaeobacter gallaeciensis]MDE4304628.1 flagellin [Phaeobacter gallaeciensis]MDE4308630.1 flagellin [Phaeobacter gallaeciensis]MDE4313087.1 flagellin [Phaeobacter gallaeciensis]
MTSILTNNGAMVALQTLNSINMNLENTQNAISTGKDVATAKDNSAIWAISKVMESDVAGFNAVSDSLALGESTVAVATAGAEQITDLLREMKEKVTTATGENVDHNKIKAEVDELKKQITSIIKGSQFNGANLLNTDGDDLTVLSSLDRDSTGTVTASNITVSSVDFETSLTLGDVNVSDSTQAELSIAKIEALIQTAVDGAAALGASAARIEKQAEFVSKVSDAMKSGIGALVDTDMEAASARLKALQTQQQLGVQALSIANSAPQTLQQLFR